MIFTTIESAFDEISKNTGNGRLGTGLEIKTDSVVSNIYFASAELLRLLKEDAIENKDLITL